MNAMGRDRLRNGQTFGEFNKRITKALRTAAATSSAAAPVLPPPAPAQDGAESVPEEGESGKK